MKGIHTSLVVVTLLAQGVLSQTSTALYIDTPTPTDVIECEPYLVQWHGGSPPYFLGLETDPGLTSVANFGSKGDALNWTWLAAVTPGEYRLTVRDGTGLQIMCAPFPVNPGSSDCLNGGGATTSNGAASTTTTQNSPTTTAGSTSPQNTSHQSSSAPSLSPSQTTPTASTGHKTNSSATIAGATVGAIVFVALVILLLFLFRRRRQEHVLDPLTPAPFTAAIPPVLSTSEQGTSEKGRVAVAGPSYTGPTRPYPSTAASVTASSRVAGSVSGVGSGAGSGTGSGSGLVELQRQIEELRQENETLRYDSPPSYT